MSISCFEFAATCYRVDPRSPRAAVQNHQTLFTSPGLALGQWFDQGRGNPINLYGLGTGDLVVFAITKGHVAVATGSGDQLLHSWYHVHDMAHAVHLWRLLEANIAGDFTKIPDETTLSNRLRRLDGGVRHLMSEKAEFDDWPTGPNNARLQYVRYIFEQVHRVKPAIFHLKPEARRWLDPHGPLGRYLRDPSSALASAS